MNLAFPLRVVAGIVVLLSVPKFASADDTRADAASASAVSYFQQIRPLFQAQCQGCHQPAKLGGEYDMTAFASLLGGGESETPAVVPGKPDESYLLEMITSVDGEAEMPKGRDPLSEEQVSLVRRWIEQGAKDDTPESAVVRYTADNPPIYTAPPVVTSLDFSPTDDWLAIAAFHEVLVYRADGSQLEKRLVGMSPRIQSVRFSPDGKRLAATGGQPGRLGEVQVWDVESGELLLSQPVTYDTVYGVAWSPDGKHVSFGCADNTVRAIDAATGEQVLFQGAHNDWPLDTVFSKDGTHVMSVSRDRTAKLTELATQRFIDNITSITPGALKGGISAVARHPERDEILVGGADGVPKLFRVFRTSKRVIGDNANLIRQFPGLRGRIFDVAISRDGKRIVAASSLDGRGEVRTYAYDFDTKLPKDLLAIMQKRAAQRSTTEKEKLDKYRREGVKVLSETTVDDSGIYAVAFSSDGATVAAAGSDGQVRLISVESGDVIKQFVPVPIQEAGSPAAVAATTDVPRLWRKNAMAASESAPTGLRVVGLRVEPASAVVRGRFDTVQFVVHAELSDGTRTDATRFVKASASSEDAQISSRGLARMLADGSAEIRFTYGELSAVAKLRAEGTQADFHPDFVVDVGPVISKMGCNAGTCHGANKGKAGFKLSLRGNDPIFDVRALTDDLASRRVNLASPDNSLMLLKATAQVPHQGGQLTTLNSPYYETLRQWIADGAPLNQEGKRVASIEVVPSNPIVQRIGESQQFRVVATYSDGSQRDVTPEAYIESGNTEVATTDEGGLAKTLRRGEAPLLARFEGKYAATTLTVMGDRSKFVWKEEPANNYVDEYVAAKLQKMKILPSELCTDAEFIRRVHLDLTGLPPAADQVRAFLADERDTRVKRNELIDRLLGSPDFVEHWTNKWADLLQVNRKFLGPEGAKLFRDWIRGQVAANRPYDEFVYDILTATGSNRENPAASYFKITRTPQDTMENTTQLFLGVRFNCNKCHDHPFERWTQDQYYETAAYFAQFKLTKDPASGKRQIGKTAVEAGKPLFEVVADVKQGEVKHDRTGQVTLPSFPYPAEAEVQDADPRRKQLAAWITSPDNAYFARSYVNRLWGYLLGVGLIEPLDDIRAGNPPSNPELLQRLTDEFVEGGFDGQAVMRLICQSRTYQRSIATNAWNEDDQINFSHAMARRLPAEVLYDAIHQVTGSVPKLPGVPAGTRAAQLPDAGIKLPDGFLATFGRPARESACECERSTGMQLGPIMALVSGPTLDQAIGDAGNELAKLAASSVPDEDLISELFMRVLNRPATPEEIKAGLNVLRRLPEDHALLVSSLKSYEESLQPKIKAQEKAREQAIAKAKAVLDAYESSVAEREAKLELAHKQRLEAATKALADYEASLPGKLSAWEQNAGKSTVWTPLDPEQLTASGGTKLEKQDDLSVFATGPKVRGEFKVVATSKLQGIRAIRLEALTDKRNPKNGPGRAPDGNFVVSEFEVSTASIAKPDEVKKQKLVDAQADFSQQTYTVSTAIDGKVPPQSNGWAIAPQMGKNHQAMFSFAEPVSGDEGVVITVVLKQQFSSNQHQLGRFRLSVTNTDGPLLLEGLPKKIKDLLAVAAADRDEKQQQELMDFYRSSDAELKKLGQAVAQAKKPRVIDPMLTAKRQALAEASKPVPVDPKLARLRSDVALSEKQLQNSRLTAAQDITWALINSPSFLFNR